MGLMDMLPNILLMISIKSAIFYRTVVSGIIRFLKTENQNLLNYKVWKLCLKYKNEAKTLLPIVRKENLLRFSYFFMFMLFQE